MYLLGHPSTTVKQVVEAHGISFAAASRAIAQPVERSILTESLTPPPFVDKGERPLRPAPAAIRGDIA
jgi:hypothetical protein